MQETATIPHTVWEILRIGLGAILGVGGTLLASLLKKKQTTAEIRKTEAETRHLELTDRLAEGTMVVELMKAGAQAVLDVEQLRRKEEFQRGRADRLETERDLLQLELDKFIRIGKGNRT